MREVRKLSMNTWEDTNSSWFLGYEVIASWLNTIYSN